MLFLADAKVLFDPLELVARHFDTDALEATLLLFFVYLGAEGGKAALSPQGVKDALFAERGARREEGGRKDGGESGDSNGDRGGRV